jgi:hypothetical protein
MHAIYQHISAVRQPLVIMGLIILAGLALAGCDEDQAPEADSLTLDDLIGEWTAISATYTSVGGRELDFLANGGSVEITVPPGGLATTRITLGESVDEWDALWVVADDGVLRSFPADWDRPVRTRIFWLIGGELTLIDGNANFDFTLTGAPGEEAREELVLVRR